MNHTNIGLQVIMDGNSRWAAQRGLPATAGHQAGLKALEGLVQSCLKWGVRGLTVSNTGLAGRCSVVVAGAVPCAGSFAWQRTLCLTSMPSTRIGRMP